MRFDFAAKGHGFRVRISAVNLVIFGAVGAALSIAYWARWSGSGRFGLHKHPNAGV